MERPRGVQEKNNARLGSFWPDVGGSAVHGGTVLLAARKGQGLEDQRFKAMSGLRHGRPAHQVSQYRPSIFDWHPRRWGDLGARSAGIYPHALPLLQFRAFMVAPRRTIGRCAPSE